MHVAIIMNGNGEWASRHGLAPTASHAAGASALRNTVALAVEAEIKTLTVYAICTPGYGRPTEEIDADLSVLGSYVRSDAHTRVEQAVRLSVIGSPEFRSQIVRGELNQNDPSSFKAARMHLRIAVDYSARDAILKAVAKAASMGNLTREIFSELVTGEAGLRDVDLVIRTSGEKRLSDFLLWESAYAELHFTDRMWPDFGGEDLAEALAAFHGRERRFGGLQPVSPELAPEAAL